MGGRAREALITAVKRAIRGRVAVCRAPVRHPWIGLTFDDGPHPTRTPRILEALASHGARATFFLLGQAAAAHPAIVRDIAEQGHEIGTHTHSHVDLSSSSLSLIDRELVESCRAIERAGAPPVHLLRPPRGSLGLRTLAGAWRRRLRLVLWSADSLDWKLVDARAIVERVSGLRLRGGDILLFHDDTQVTVEVLPAVLDHLARGGWRPVTISELLGRSASRMGTRPRRDD